MQIIKQKKSVIPACDVENLQELKKLVQETHDVEGIGAYKIGLQLVIPFGMKKVVDVIRSITALPIIYDHQKAATDIPELGEKFAKACRDSGVNAVILFPQAGPVTEEAWIKACQKEKLGIIVGGEMTHDGYLEFIKNDAPDKIYNIAAKLGIKEFVVPGNKPERIKHYRKLLGEDAIFYSPGLIAQGGSLTEGAKAAGNNWHAIIGRALYKADDIKKAAGEFVRGIV